MLDVVELVIELPGGGAVSIAFGLSVQPASTSADATAANFKTVEIFIIERHSKNASFPNARGNVNRGSTRTAV
jgi:hypothetical protein